MSQPKQYLCKNREGNCPNYVNSTVVTVGGAEKFVCPLHLANCEKDHLEPVSPPEPSWKRGLKKIIFAVVPILCLAVVFWLWRTHQPPSPPPASLDVVLVVDGQLLNAVMIRAPEWLNEQVAPLADSNHVFALGLWGCRPVEANGQICTPLTNYTPNLLPPAEFQRLHLVSAPKPDAWPESLRKGSPSYDLLSGLKSALQGTRWHSPTNRYIIVITESSAFPKSSEKNAAKIGEQEVKKLADRLNAKILAIHILVPNDLMADDQRLAEAQLRLMVASQDYYYTVHKSPVPVDPTQADFELVTAYADGIKGTFSQIVQSIMRSSP